MENEFSEDIIKGVGFLTDEVEGVKNAIIAESKSEKKYYDESLGETIKKSLEGIIEKLSVEKKEEKYFDENLGETIKNALSEAVVSITKLGRPVFDLSPMISIAENISNQNKAIIETLSDIASRDNGAHKFEGLLKMVLDIIKKNNDFLEYLSIPKEAPVIPIQKNKEWQFDVVRDTMNGTISQVIAKQK